MSKPSIPKGTRDFGPRAMVRRHWMFGTLRHVFEAHGFVPIQTPSFENLSTLTGKYGEEGDQLIFKILNNGDYLAKADDVLLASKDSTALTSRISKKALRYDLTVPFARFVVMNRNELTFPFKRYQIQNVWRGDRPGKGRYQEFTQCDCDIIGSESTLCELELVQIFSEALTALGVPGFRIQINDRRLLQASALLGGVTEAQFTDWTVAVDKLDKVGVDGVIREFEERGLPQSAAAQLPELVALRDHKDPMAALDALATLLEGHASGESALASVRDLIARAVNTGVNLDALRMDPLLARGLDYYTGAIFEVTVDGAPVGSICGGGRYDDLTGIFGWKGMSGVGISFGADRIEDILNHFDAWPAMASDGLDAMVVQMEQGELPKELRATQALREAGLSAELYPDPAKLKKQFKYA
ncbi:MAG: histidine--tRNA ligase, partial [Bacteroidota bacterium]|nr:histidine--tRNA ligase [Bacteroidota bacterium]